MTEKHLFTVNCITVHNGMQNTKERERKEEIWEAITIFHIIIVVQDSSIYVYVCIHDGLVQSLGCKQPVR